MEVVNIRDTGSVGALVDIEASSQGHRLVVAGTMLDHAATMVGDSGDTSLYSSWKFPHGSQSS